MNAIKKITSDNMADTPENNAYFLQNLPRVKLATRFLDEELLPTFRQNTAITAAVVDTLIAEFQKRNPVKGNDFDLDHVWGAALKRVGYYEQILEEDVDQLPKEAFWVFLLWKKLTDIELANVEDQQDRKKN
ncbi:MAG: hypothetical protein H6673_15740 [Anaerolineales bacterium]|nr:hypothetical protein [Anaerolineales bacterium]